MTKGNITSQKKRDIKLKDEGRLSRSTPSVQDYAVETADSIWLDEQSASLTVPEQVYLEQMLEELGANVHGLFSELVKLTRRKTQTSTDADHVGIHVQFGVVRSPGLCSIIH